MTAFVIWGFGGRERDVVAIEPPLPWGWADEVRALYLRSEEMDASEFEQLLDAALAGKRPDHHDLPAYLPLEKYLFVPSGWKVEQL